MTMVIWFRMELGIGLFKLIYYINSHNRNLEKNSRQIFLDLELSTILADKQLSFSHFCLLQSNSGSQKNNEVDLCSQTMTEY